MPPNFRIKVILFQNSYLSVYHATTVLLRDIRASPDFSGRVLYNVPTVPLPIHSALFPFFLFLEQTLTVDAVITKASNPSKSSVLSSHHPSDYSSHSNLFRLQWRPSTTFLRYASKFYSPSIGRHLVFLFFSSSFHPIPRK